MLYPEGKMKRTIFIAVVLFFVVTLAYAHQPRISFGSRHPLEDPQVVDKPEISKAYYGELTGEADYYKIDSPVPFTLYLNILTPDEPNARADMTVEVITGGQSIFMLIGRIHPWSKFYEEFARDNYLKGPELEENVTPGTYYIKVYNNDNRGKYSLAVGKIESFPLAETIKTAFTLPEIKVHFFNKPAYSAFTNLIGLFLFVYLLIAVVIIWAIVFIIHRLIRK
jgi:hypothetical protein